MLSKLSLSAQRGLSKRLFYVELEPGDSDAIGGDAVLGEGAFSGVI